MIDLIGLKAATDKALAVARAEFAQVSGPAKAVLEEVAASLRQEREAMAQFMETAEAAEGAAKQADLLMQRVGAAIEKAPAEWRPLLHDLLGLVDTYVRVGFRVSGAAQTWDKVGNAALALITDLRAKGLLRLLTGAGG